MRDPVRDIFKRKKLVVSCLEPYGFRWDADHFAYQKTLEGSGFLLTVRITAQGEVSTEVNDPVFDGLYTLHLVDGATGAFVAGIRNECEDLLTDIADRCFEPDVFKSQQALQLIEYVRDTYADELEYLWKRFPENAVWRREDNRKWYGALLTVSRGKLGLDSAEDPDEMVEVIDLRYPPEELERLLDGRVYLPGWHMNKKSWYTIILDGSVSTEELCQRLDRSYLLA